MTSLRLVHTADNHIGISFKTYPEEVRHRLLEERFAALERLVRTANERKAHFFVVAGDLFDRLTVRPQLVERTVKILAAFEGEHALVLAGNHDYCEGPDSDLWKRFRHVAEGTNVLALLEPTVTRLEFGDGAVCFYPAPCASKHSRKHAMGWVAGVKKAPEDWHIGVAHGNVDGFALDASQRYFTMTEGDLAEAGVTAWLLGHIHVPFPAPGFIGKPPFFMPGIHTPDSVKCAHPGHAWWIELERDGTSRHERLRSGAIRFVRLTRELRDAGDLEKLATDCVALDAPNTVLDLQLSGRLAEDERAALNEFLTMTERSFLHLSRDVNIAPALNAKEVARAFPDGTLPHALLTELLADEETSGDASLAWEILQSLRAS